MTHHLPELEQPSYFEGQRLTADQLNANVAGELDRRWFHNRALHGTGISTGLVVTASDNGKEVIVGPGHTIDGAGHDLVVTEPVTVQVPPVAGSETNPDVFWVVVRWPDDADEITGSGLCDATGAIGIPERPVLEIVPELIRPAVPLARVEVKDCTIHLLDLSPRNVLGERRLPYVNGGVSQPAATKWQLVPVGSAKTYYGVTATVDTSVAGFRSRPRYQARVSGRRALEVALPKPVEYLLWTTDAYVTDETEISLTIEVAIPTVWETGTSTTSSAPSTPPQKTFHEFLAASQTTDPGDTWADDPDLFPAEVVNTLEWGVTWIGVEGTI